MLPTPRIMLAMILAVVVQYVDGNQRIVHVSDSITSGEDDNSHILCCVYGICSCNSLDHALANLTSNVLINITTDVMLSSLVRASDLENVTIFGHNDPTVNCKHVGGIHFTFCNNCIIQGITWDGCGTENFDNHTEPGLLFNYSSNVIIKKCSFQHLVGQAVVLLEMSGYVNFNNCKFINNSHYRGHGAAIFCSSNNTSQFDLTINNFNFSYNKIKSLVYLENRLLKYNKTFCRNQGTSVYAINHKIFLNGKVLFQNNTAENGAGIYISDHSTVVFDKNSDVTFIQNSARHKGGAVFISSHSSIICDQNSIVTFQNNSATNGTVYSEVSSNVTFKANCCVTFGGNSATQRGAAIYSDSSRVTFTGNANTVFSSNYVSTNDTVRCMSIKNAYDHHGGSIYSINFSRILFEGSSTTVFSNNTADYGGTICSFDHGHVSFEGNSNILFSNNVACEGGAIYHRYYGSISFKGNATTAFSNNNAAYYGGALYSYYYGSTSFEENSKTVFYNNIAKYGGALYSYYYGSTSFEENSKTAFYNNIAKYSGALYSYYYGSTSFEESSTTVFIIILLSMVERYTLIIMVVHLLKITPKQCLIIILLIMVELYTPIIMVIHLLKETPQQC